MRIDERVTDWGRRYGGGGDEQRRADVPGRQGDAATGALEAAAAPDGATTRAAARVRPRRDQLHGQLATFYNLEFARGIGSQVDVISNKEARAESIL